MQTLRDQAAHLVMATIVTVAMIILAVKGIIDGSNAIAIIGLATGVSLGGAVSSLSPSSATANQAVTIPVKVAPTSVSPSVTTKTTTDTHTVSEPIANGADSTTIIAPDLAPPAA